MDESTDKANNAEEHLRLLAEETNDYFSMLYSASLSASKQYTPFNTILGGMVDNLKENLRTLVFYLKTLIFGGLYVLFNLYLDSITTISGKGKVAVAILVLIPFLMYWRRVTIDRMTTPGDDLFHFGTFEKFRKAEAKAFAKLISEKFSPKNFKEDLRKVSIDETIIKDYKDNIEELKKDKELFQGFSAEYKESAAKLRENLLETEKERDLFSQKTKQLGLIVEQLKSSFQSIASNEFNEKALNNLPLGFNYSIYELNAEGTVYTISNHGGINEDDLPNNIRTSETASEIIKSHRLGEEELLGVKSYLKCISVTTGVKVVAQLHLDEETIKKLNNELHPEHLLAKISVQMAFKQLGICLFVYYTVKRHAEIKAKGAI